MQTKEPKQTKRRLLQAALLLAAVCLIAFGIWRGEAATVLAKGITICLECIGIG